MIQLTVGLAELVLNNNILQLNNRALKREIELLLVHNLFYFKAFFHERVREKQFPKSFKQTII